MKDTNGTLLERGCKVVYNRSGYLHVGRIEKFGNPTRYHGVTIYVRNTQGDGLLSRIKDPRSTLVIEPAGVRGAQGPSYDSSKGFAGPKGVI